MFALGTIINTAAIVAGGTLGLLFGGLMALEKQEALKRVCGLGTLFIGLAGAMEWMLHVEGGRLVSGQAMMVVLSLAFGTALGELLNIELGFERFGAWLKHKSGNARDSRFIDAFVVSSLTVCIGAMAIVGAIKDGLLGDYSILAVKSVLDFIIVAVMASAMGRGAVFSAIPVFIFQGSITVLARLIEPVMTPEATANLSLVGSILIFAVGVNLIWGKRFSVANMLPAVVFAVLAEYVPLPL
jgi:uncharacterized membrane protein YqgA involved in biofilm formation